MQQEVIAQSTHYTVCALLVPPTGFEGVCNAALDSWGIPFKGSVEAA